MDKRKYVDHSCNLRKSWERMAAARAKILPKIRKDYNRMLAKHLKNNYVVATLAAKYGISERTVYNYVSKTKFQ